MPTFAREISFRPADPERLAVRDEHRAHIRDLFERGLVRMSGPFADDCGALIVYRTDDEAAARELIAADPYSRAGVVAEVGLREWNTVFPAD